MSKSLSGPVKNSITGKTNKVVIFFHGYGADGNDLISLSDSFINTLPDAVYYSPNAPEKCEMGGLGYQWFPIKQNNDGSLDFNAEKEIIKQQLKDTGKPDNILEKMMDGKLKKFYEENTLLGQKFVIDPSTSVAEYIDKVSNDYKCDISINKFVRYEIGS